MELTAEQHITRQHVWLMNNPKYVLWSGILMMGKTEVVGDMPTACTNGRDVWYGRAFVEKQTEPKLRGLVLHENLHKGLRQLTMWKSLFDQDKALANQAADYVINLIIYDTDPEGKEVALPDGALLDESFRGMDTAQVFRTLQQRAKDNPQPQGPPQQGDAGLDSHDWAGANELTDAEQQLLDREIDNALRQGRELSKKLGGATPRAVEDILTPKVDWRDALRDFVSAHCAGGGLSTWRKPARRWVSQDIYLPSQIDETVGRLVLAVDTSGSIGGDLLRLFLGGVYDILRTAVPDGVDLLYWGSRIVQHEKYDPEGFDAMLRSTRPKDGGGTDPQCVVDYIKAHKIKADCCVVLTDGIVSSWGTGWSCPVLWAITTEGVVANVGKSVKI
jgi:predicted metal-dependent peptidase